MAGAEEVETGVQGKEGQPQAVPGLTAAALHLHPPAPPLMSSFLAAPKTEAIGRKISAQCPSDGGVPSWLSQSERSFIEVERVDN